MSALAACASGPGDDGVWQLEAIEGESVRAGATLEIREGGTQVSGTGGCNRFRGGLVLDGPKLAIGPIAATRRMCEAPLMDLETRYFAILALVAVRESRGDTLRLLSGDGSELLRFRRAP